MATKMQLSTWTRQILATDLWKAYEVLSRGCEARNGLQLTGVAFVFDQAFYAKAIVVYWKNKGCLTD